MKRAFYVVLLACPLMTLNACQQQPWQVKVHHYGASSGGGSLGTHTLKPKENLWTVAEAYHVDLRDLLDINNLQAPYRLKAGMRLKLPAPMTYRVQAGDSLYTVSRLFQTTTTDLVRVNHLASPYVFKTGQVIKLPGRHMQVSQSVQISPQDRRSNNYAAPVPSVQSERLPPVTTTGATMMNPPHIKDDGRGFLRPVEGPVISGYGPKAGGLHNDGVNFKTIRGAPVRAAKAGQVVYAGNDIEGYGNLMLIRHPDGFVTAYAHLDKILAQKGDVVKRGQVIGKAGATGHVNGPQLHFEIRRGRDAVDPAVYL